MGRGRSKGRTDKMNRIKRERNAKKELLRLKKTLGLIDADGNEIIKKVDDIAQVKAPKQMTRKEKAKKAEAALKVPIVWDVSHIAKDPEVKEEKVKVVNENSKIEHIFSTTTMKDQFGTFPVWMNKNKSDRRIKRKLKGKKGNYNAFWTNAYVPFTD